MLKVSSKNRVSPKTTNTKNSFVWPKKKSVQQNIAILQIIVPEILVHTYLVKLIYQRTNN